MLRLLGRDTTEYVQSQALQYKLDINHIFSCSWGPTDDGATLQAPSQLIKDSFLRGIEEGRNGLGTIYTQASGNGGIFQDNCNFDGWANNVYTIAIGGVTSNHSRPVYSEICAANLAVGYGSDDAKGIVRHFLFFTTWPIFHFSNFTIAKPCVSFMCITYSLFSGSTLQRSWNGGRKEIKLHVLQILWEHQL